MLKKLTAKLAAAAAAVILAAAASGASAYAQSTFAGVVYVAPGTRQCIGNPTQAFYNASVEDFVIEGAPVKFTFQSGARQISDSGGSVLAFSDYIYARPSFSPSFFPDFFPGYFRTCARNDGYEYSTVYLSVTVDQ
ncbi:MAG: hypothetical protein LC795_12865 [Acidobacteria bacterium]|nr:hypothetical protein [Acidobacteriota bacterium]